MYIAVPDKRKNGTFSNTYKVSVWDNQAVAAAQYIKQERKQLVTVSGQLKLDEYSCTHPNKDGVIEPMMRLDFASILDYGNKQQSQEDIINGANTDKQNYAEFIDDVDATAIKMKATKIKNRMSAEKLADAAVKGKG